MCTDNTAFGQEAKIGIAGTVPCKYLFSGRRDGPLRCLFARISIVSRRIGNVAIIFRFPAANFSLITSFLVGKNSL